MGNSSCCCGHDGGATQVTSITTDSGPLSVDDAALYHSPGLDEACGEEGFLDEDPEEGLEGEDGCYYLQEDVDEEEEDAMWLEHDGGAISETAPPPAREELYLEAGGLAQKGRALAAAQGPQELRLRVERAADASIGLNVDALSGSAAFVDDIVEGAIKDWNALCSLCPGGEEQQLRLNDHIVSVNSVRGEQMDRMLEELRTSTSWDLVVHRPIELAVFVDLERSPSLGLELKYSPNGRTLYIFDLGEGSVSDWNAEHPPSKSVKKGDRIVEINGTVGKACDLLNAAANAAALDMVILHYP